MEMKLTILLHFTTTRRPMRDPQGGDPQGAGERSAADWRLHAHVWRQWLLQRRAVHRISVRHTFIIM